MIVPTSEAVGSKRQRRPSLRLGDIGGGNHHQPYDSHVRRVSNTVACVDHKMEASNSSKVQAFTNLTSNSNELKETLHENLDSITIGSWKGKDSKKRGSTKRVRSNWVSKNHESGGDDKDKNDDLNKNNFEVGDSKYSNGEYMEDGYNGFNMKNSGSLMKEQNLVHSQDNLAVDGNERKDTYCNRRDPVGVRRGDNEGLEVSGPADEDAMEWNRGGSEDGVRIWLNSLGLGRYAPVFEVHEVDYEVLPMLTLADLKDMGINAVGSRRKMYCAIQKLGEGFS